MKTADGTGFGRNRMRKGVIRAKLRLQLDRISCEPHREDVVLRRRRVVNQGGTGTGATP